MSAVDAQDAGEESGAVAAPRRSPEDLAKLVS